MKFTKIALGLSALSLTILTSCVSIDDDGGALIVPTETLGGELATQTLDPNTVYIIDRFAYVPSGNILTIPAGTILKAKDGQGADASALVVARGGKLFANGTAAKPVIFTSINDDIQPGETKSTLDPRLQSQGQWGGIIILGNAPVSVKPANSADGIGKEGYVEGIPSSYNFSKFGGNDVNDSSGSLQYVSIRFSGSTLSTDEEVQGLTLGGVGAGTVVDHIEIFSSFDDGVEFFGGTVNVSNLLVAFQTDDGIDIDQNYAGTIDNAVVLLYNPATGNDGMEIDGPEADGVNDTGLFTVNRVTIYQKGGANIARLKSNAQGTINHLAARDFAGQTIMLDGAKQVTISNSEFNQDEAKAITAANVQQLNVQNNLFNVSNFTTGADESEFSWTTSRKDEGLF